MPYYNETRTQAQASPTEELDPNKRVSNRTRQGPWAGGSWTVGGAVVPPPPSPSLSPVAPPPPPQATPQPPAGSNLTTVSGPTGPVLDPQPGYASTTGPGSGGGVQPVQTVPGNTVPSLPGGTNVQPVANGDGTTRAVVVDMPIPGNARIEARAKGDGTVEAVVIDTMSGKVLGTVKPGAPGKYTPIQAGPQSTPLTGQQFGNLFSNVGKVGGGVASAIGSTLGNFGSALGSVFSSPVSSKRASSLPSVPPPTAASTLAGMGLTEAQWAGMSEADRQRALNAAFQRDPVRANIESGAGSTLGASPTPGGVNPYAAAGIGAVLGGTTGMAAGTAGANVANTAMGVNPGAAALPGAQPTQQLEVDALMQRYLRAGLDEIRANAQAQKQQVDRALPGADQGRKLDLYRRIDEKAAADGQKLELEMMVKAAGLRDSAAQTGIRQQSVDLELQKAQRAQVDSALNSLLQLGALYNARQGNKVETPYKSTLSAEDRARELASYQLGDVGSNVVGFANKAKK